MLKEVRECIHEYCTMQPPPSTAVTSYCTATTHRLPHFSPTHARTHYTHALVCALLRELLRGRGIPFGSLRRRDVQTDRRFIFFRVFFGECADHDRDRE